MCFGDDEDEGQKGNSEHPMHAEHPNSDCGNAEGVSERGVERSRWTYDFPRLSCTATKKPMRVPKVGPQKAQRALLLTG